MTKKAALHPLKELFVVGQPLKNHGALMSAMAHAAKQAEAGHYKETVTGYSDTTDPSTGVISRSISWTMTPSDKNAKADPAPAL